MVDDSYISMVSKILPCHNDLWCLWWVDFLVLFISKCCYQIYGVLKYIANISGLTALPRYHSGALFLEGFDHYCFHNTHAHIHAVLALEYTATPIQRNSKGYTCVYTSTGWCTVLVKLYTILTCNNVTLPMHCFHRPFSYTTLCTSPMQRTANQCTASRTGFISFTRDGRQASTRKTFWSDAQIWSERRCRGFQMGFGAII